MDSETAFSILNISPDASPEQIKAAFRKIAKKHHPDKSKDRPEIFIRAREAYITLLSKPRIQEAPRKVSGRIRKGIDIRVVVDVTLEDLGKTKRVKTTRQTLCPVCQGTGSISKTLNICSECTGSGYDRVSLIIGPKKFCNTCRGYGTCSKADCKKCKGTGTVPETVVHSFVIPQDLDKVVLTSQGSYGLGSNKAGNLIIIPSLKDSQFRVEDNNLKGKITISAVQAILGDTILLQKPAVQVVIPPRTSHWDTIKVTDPFGNGYNLLLKVEIDTKREISKKELSLFNDLLQLQKGTSNG